ncbi:MAG: hypothetical protein VX738_11995 [Planctomycetota bacterium]|nr:hypothetical protein [Planctomycetota bacterium]
MFRFTTLATVLLLTITSMMANAQDKQNKQKKPAAAGSKLAENTIKRHAKAELTEEQVASIKKLAAEVGPKINALRKKANLTPEQTKAVQAARAKAKADGLKGKAANEAVDAAGKYTEEQAKVLAEVKQLNQKYFKDVQALLTDEQRKASRAAAPKTKKPAPKK